MKWEPAVIGWKFRGIRSWYVLYIFYYCRITQIVLQVTLPNSLDLCSFYTLKIPQFISSLFSWISLDRAISYLDCILQKQVTCGRLENK